MRLLRIPMLVVVSGLTAMTTMAVTRYVSLGGHDNSPYTNWYDAATDPCAYALWDAVQDGDVIVVSNGTYNMWRRVNFGAKSVTITGLYGAAETIFNGGAGGYAAFRSGADQTLCCKLYGVTITNYVHSDNGTIQAVGARWEIADCVIAGNHANAGAGVSLATGSTTFLDRVVIKGNWANVGGGIYIAKNYEDGNTVFANDCEISKNIAANSSYAGGGVYHYGTQCVLNNCLVMENAVTNNNGYGGGVFCLEPGFTAQYCRVEGNMATANGGAFFFASQNNTVKNCTVISNRCNSGTAGISSGSLLNRAENSVIAHNICDGIGGGVKDSTVLNCTIVSNTARRGGGVRGCACLNTIVFHNTATDGSYQWSSNRYGWDGSSYTNCCTAGEPTDGAQWVNCIVSNPVFGAAYPDNFRPIQDSPCVNAGMNEAWMQGACDVVENDRIAEFIVDIGAYEFHPPGTVLMFR